MQPIDTDVTSIAKFEEDLKSFDLLPISGNPDLGFLVDYFPDEFFDNYKIPARNLQKLILQVKSLETSLYGAIPVICGGPKCQMRHVCPFDKQGMAPVGYQCPMERILLERSIGEYIKSQKLDVNNIDEMEKARELAECDLYIKFRTAAVLAKDPLAFQELAKRYHPGTGQLIEEKNEISKAFDVRMRMAQRRDKILEELIGTRKGKIKHKLIKPGEDPSKAAERLYKKLQDAEVISEETVDEPE